MSAVRIRPALGAVATAAIITFAQPVIVHAEDSTNTTADTTFDLERDLSDCVNSNPQPNCGRKPTSSGDRGGAMQYATFAAIVVGLSIIFTVVFRNVIRADREKEKNLPENTPGYF